MAQNYVLHLIYKAQNYKQHDFHKSQPHVWHNTFKNIKVGKTYFYNSSIHIPYIIRISDMKRHALEPKNTYLNLIPSPSSGHHVHR